MSEPLTLDSQFDHERVLIERRPEIGLTLILAIHSTALGPGEGGLRMKSYPRFDDAVVDALRLSSAMTLKSAAAGLPFGGGKGVVLLPPQPFSRQEIMHAVGEVVDGLEGQFIVGPDSGTGTDDMDLIRERTRHVVGYSTAHGGLGDPSPSTAATVLGSIRHALEALDGSSALAGRKVAVLGVGKVGARLAKQLTESGAAVTIADIDAEQLARVEAETGASVGTVDAFLESEVDVLAPCGPGELIGAEDVGKIRARVIAGGANNPLVDARVAEALHDRSVLYVPDFIANCGGVVHNWVEYGGGTIEQVPAALEDAIDRAGAILERARREARSPLAVATDVVAERISAAAS